MSISVSTPRALFDQFVDPRSSLPLFQPLTKSPSRWQASPQKRTPARLPNSSPVKKTPVKSIASPSRLFTANTPNRLSLSITDVHKAILSWTKEEAMHHCDRGLIKELISMLLLPKCQAQACETLSFLIKKLPSALVREGSNGQSLAKNLPLALSWTDSRPQALELLKNLSSTSPSSVLSSKHLLTAITQMLTDAVAKPEVKELQEAQVAITAIDSLIQLSTNEATTALLRDPRVIVEPICKLFSLLKDQSPGKKVMKQFLVSFALMAEASISAGHHICERKILYYIAQLSLSSPELSRDCLLTLALFAGRPDDETRGHVKEVCEENEVMSQLVRTLVGSSLKDISSANSSIVLLWTVASGDDYKKDRILQLGSEQGGDVPRSLGRILDTLLTAFASGGNQITLPNDEDNDSEDIKGERKPQGVKNASLMGLLENVFGLASCLLSLLKSSWSKRDQCIKILSLPLNPQGDSPDSPRSITLTLAQNAIRCIKLGLGGLNLLTNLTLHPKGVEAALEADLLSLFERTKLEELLAGNSAFVAQTAALIANSIRNSSPESLEKLIATDLSHTLELLAQAVTRISPSPHPSPPHLNYIHSLCSAIQAVSSQAPRGTNKSTESLSHAALFMAEHLLLVCGRSGPASSPSPLAESAGRAALASLHQLLNQNMIHPDRPGIMEKVMVGLPTLLESTVCKEGADRSTSLLVISLLQELSRSWRLASALICSTRVSNALLKGFKLMREEMESLLVQMKPYDRYGSLKRLDLKGSEKQGEDEEQEQVTEERQVEGGLEAEEVEMPLEVDEDEEGPRDDLELEVEVEVSEGDVVF